jgi:hypothetical protein
LTIGQFEIKIVGGELDGGLATVLLEDGWKVGFVVGLAEGWDVGRALGLLVGHDEGSTEGLLDGDIDG